MVGTEFQPKSLKMFTQRIKSALEKYFNEVLRTSLGYKETYKVEISTNGGSFYIQTNETSELISMLSNENLKRKIEDTLLKGMSSLHTTHSVQLLILDSNTILLHFGTNRETDIEILRYYADTKNVSRFIEYLTRLDTSDKEKFGLFQLILNTSKVEDILRMLTLDGFAVYLSNQPNFIEIVIQNTKGPIDHQNSALYLYSRLNNDDNFYLPNDLQLSTRGGINALNNAIKNLIDRSMENKILHLLEKYADYIEDDDLIELYNYLLNSKNVPALIKVVTTMANARVIESLYGDTEIITIYS